MSQTLRMQDKNILDHYSDLSVGDVLSRARKASGLSISQVAEATLISSTTLIALEECDKSNLPSRVYTLGFIKTYAEFLKLDPDKIVYLYKIQVIGEDEQQHVKRRNTSFQYISNMFQMDAPIGMILMMITGFILIALSFINIGATVFSASHTSIEPQSKATEIPKYVSSLSEWQELAIPDLTQNRVGLILPDEGATAYGVNWAPQNMVLKAQDTVWISVTGDDDRVLFNAIMAKGDVLQIPKAGIYHFETMYGKALQLYFDGEKRGTFKGQQNENVRFSLPADDLEDFITPAR